MKQSVFILIFFLVQASLFSQRSYKYIATAHPWVSTERIPLKTLFDKDTLRFKNPRFVNDTTYFRYPTLNIRYYGQFSFSHELISKIIPPDKVVITYTDTIKEKEEGSWELKNDLLRFRFFAKADTTSIKTPVNQQFNYKIIKLTEILLTLVKIK